MAYDKTDSEKRGYGKREDRKQSARKARREGDRKAERYPAFRPDGKRVMVSIPTDEGVRTMGDVLSEAELSEEKWGGKFLDQKHSSLVSHVGQELGWRIDQAAAFAIELLQDVNAHKEAAALNSLMFKMRVF